MTVQAWKKTIFTQARFDPKLFYPKKWLNFYKSEFATKQCKMYFSTSRSKTSLPHIYIGKNYVIIFFVPLFKVKVKIYQIKSHKYYPKKREIAT